MRRSDVCVLCCACPSVCCATCKTCSGEPTTSCKCIFAAALTTVTHSHETASRRTNTDTTSFFSLSLLSFFLTDAHASASVSLLNLHPATNTQEVNLKVRGVCCVLTSDWKCVCVFVISTRLPSTSPLISLLLLNSLLPAKSESSGESGLSSQSSSSLSFPLQQLEQHSHKSATGISSHSPLLFFSVRPQH